MAHLDRAAILSAFDAALVAVDPAAATARSLAELGARGVVDLGTTGGIVAIGKAANAMANGAMEVVGPVPAVVVSSSEGGGRMPVLVGDHPIPGPASFRAGSIVQDFVRDHGNRPILFLISGGGSALCETPAGGVTQDDIVAMNSVLVRSGLDITEINAIRTVASGIKGGALIAAVDARCTTLVVSDIPGGQPEQVASGPSIPSSLGDAASQLVADPGLAALLPTSVVAAAMRWAPPSPRPDDVVEVIASGDTAADAAATQLRQDGFDVSVGPRLVGETGAEVHATLLGASAGLLVRSGETALAVHGDGTGGRNQHAALIAAADIAGTERLFAALGTDGRDGATDAAGAVVDGESAERIRRAGIDMEDAVERFDSNAALAAADDLVVTGPTGTNVADLWIAGG